MNCLKNHVQIWIAPLIILVVCSSLFLTNLDDLNNFTGDETLWLAVSNTAFRLYFIEHNFTDPAWQHEFSTFGSRQPQIGKYIIGLGTYSVNYTGAPYTSYHYNWQHDLTWNMANGGVPPADVVAAGRLPIAIMGVLACLFFYWLVTLVTNWWTALLATSSLVQANLLLESSRRAMIDAPALAFGLLTLIGLVYMIRLLRNQQTCRAIGITIVCGLACGLAISTKLNTLLIFGICGLVLLGEFFYALLKRPHHGWLILMCFILMNVCAALIFYISNPFLYQNILGGIQHLLELRHLVASIPLEQLKDPAARMQAVWQSTQQYAPLAHFEQSYDRWLLLIGIIGLAVSALQNPAAFRSRQLDIIVLWIVVSYVGITLWLPHPWGRYFLPLQPGNAFLQAYGVAWILQGLWHWYANHPRRRHTPGVTTS